MFAKTDDHIRLLQNKDSICRIKEDLEATFDTQASVTDGVITFRVPNMLDADIREKINRTYGNTVYALMGNVPMRYPSAIILHCQDDSIVSVRP